jgi:hypothetical protein
MREPRRIRCYSSTRVSLDEYPRWSPPDRSSGRVLPADSGMSPGINPTKPSTSRFPRGCGDESLSRYTHSTSGSFFSPRGQGSLTPRGRDVLSTASTNPRTASYAEDEGVAKPHIATPRRRSTIGGAQPHLRDSFGDGVAPMKCAGQAAGLRWNELNPDGSWQPSGFWFGGWEESPGGIQ